MDLDRVKQYSALLRLRHREAGAAVTLTLDRVKQLWPGTTGGTRDDGVSLCAEAGVQTAYNIAQFYMVEEELLFRPGLPNRYGKDSPGWGEEVLVESKDHMLALMEEVWEMWMDGEPWPRTSL
jgi:hypothetical protein